MHAFVILLMPFRVSDHIAPAHAFLVLTGVYVTLLAVTTLPGILAFHLENRRASGRGSPALRATKAIPSAITALFYFSLPASLMLTEGPDLFVVAVSLFLGLAGYLLHRTCLSLAFSPGGGRVVRALALTAPLLLILARAWPG
jgi:hypothetical protein